MKDLLAYLWRQGIFHEQPVHILVGVAPGSWLHVSSVSSKRGSDRIRTKLPSEMDFADIENSRYVVKAASESLEAGYICRHELRRDVFRLEIRVY